MNVAATPRERGPRRIRVPVALPVASVGLVLMATESIPWAVSTAVAGTYLVVATRGLQRARDDRAAAGRRAEARNELDLARSDLRAGASAADTMDRVLAAFADDEALDRLRRRLVGIAAVSRRLGVPVADLLDRLADDERAAARADRVMRAHTAAGGASARTLAALPLLGVLVGELLGSSPLRWLTSDVAGSIALTAMTVLHVVGLAWAAHIRRSTDPSHLPAPAARRASPALIAVTVVAIALTVLTTVAGPWALTAVVAAPIGIRTVRRAVERRRRDERASIDARSSPFALDVAAACLRSGTSTATALWAAADVAPPIADALRAAARAMRFGGDPVGVLEPVPGGAALARTLRHSARTGAGLADAIAVIADDVRGERRATAEEAAAGSGVRLVLPLCACFLPAFIVGGLVPIVASVLETTIAAR